ncbi:RxLR effector protein [Phytophthora megakarya]|uniref:RxLR effector protein n=1 Tax=Phytophthora megakarya TaxID=4795 RepID=A0A225WB34_9STRA|nr:RxLR effector protein [Phytophthora megakarya]
MNKKNWIDEGKSANDVFKLLKLEKEGGAVLTSPLWSTWNSYVTMLNKKNPEESIYSVLNAQYGENNLRMMISDVMKHARTKDVAVKLQEEAWRAEGNTADDIFKLLKLDEKGISFIESPMLSSWISYATKLGTLEEKSGEFAAIVYLESRFDNMDLARKLSLEKHRNNLAMTKGAKQLRILQFRYWINRGVDPQMIAKRLMRENDELDITANVRVVIDFHEFYLANGGNRFY